MAKSARAAIAKSNLLTVLLLVLDICLRPFLEGSNHLGSAQTRGFLQRLGNQLLPLQSQQPLRCPELVRVASVSLPRFSDRGGGRGCQPLLRGTRRRARNRHLAVWRSPASARTPVCRLAHAGECHLALPQSGGSPPLSLSLGSIESHFALFRSRMFRNGAAATATLLQDGFWLCSGVGTFKSPPPKGDFEREAFPCRECVADEFRRPERETLSLSRLSVV